MPKVEKPGSRKAGKLESEMNSSGKRKGPSNFPASKPPRPMAYKLRGFFV